ncbi:hypothetical protein ABZP36_007530 [Zizania latifolia]
MPRDEESRSDAGNSPAILLLSDSIRVNSPCICDLAELRRDLVDRHQGHRLMAMLPWRSPSSDFALFPNRWSGPLCNSATSTTRRKNKQARFHLHLQLSRQLRVLPLNFLHGFVGNRTKVLSLL